jgi:glutathione reductase (NADPH)
MYEGEGKVLDAHTVALTTPDGEVKHFTAKHILIATGGRAVLLDIPGKVGDSKETGLCFYVMCVPCAKYLPRRVVIAGAGYVSLLFYIPSTFFIISFAV